MTTKIIKGIGFFSGLVVISVLGVVAGASLGLAIVYTVI